MMQGVTYYWPTSSDRTIEDNSASDATKFRVLLKFNCLQDYLPATAAVNQALLNLTLLNWESKTNNLQVGGRGLPWGWKAAGVGGSGGGCKQEGG